MFNDTDRDLACFTIQCVLSIWQSIHSHFIEDPIHHRTITTTTPPQLQFISSTLTRWKQEYVSAGFHMVARYPPTSTWQLPGPAKLLPKRKDLEVYSPNFTTPRLRPVVQLTTMTGRHPWYSIYRYAASAIRYMFLQGDTGWTLTSTAPFAEQLQHKHDDAQVAFAQSTVVLANFDVDKCYTELPKHHLYAVAHNLIYSSTAPLISVHKYTRVCVTGRTLNSHRYHTLTLDHIWAAVKHELDNAYFTIGTCTFEQTWGIFMGGMFSAILMIAFCAHHESRIYTLFPEPHIHIDGLREMDDGTVIIALDTSACDPVTTTTTIISRLDSHIYTPPTHATVDTCTDDFHMLENTITNHHNTLTVHHHSKNFIHACVNHSQRFLRGTSALSCGSRSWLRTTTTADLSRVARNSPLTHHHRPHILRGILEMAYEKNICLLVPVAIITQSLLWIADNASMEMLHQCYSAAASVVQSLHPEDWVIIICHLGLRLG